MDTMLQPKKRILILVYEYALIANLLLNFGGIKTSALFFCFYFSLALFVFHWFLPTVGKKITYGFVTGFLSWFFWLRILGFLAYQMDSYRYHEHSPWELVVFFVPILLGIGYGLWVVLKRESSKFPDQIYLELVCCAFLTAALLK